MAEPKIAKVTDVKPIPSDREGLFNSWVSQSSELAERATATCFGIVRDVRAELNQRFTGVINLVEGSQQGMIKLVRGVNDRMDRLAEDTIDTIENVVLGVIRAARDTTRDMAEVASNLSTRREAARA
jgi:phage-related protein